MFDEASLNLLQSDPSVASIEPDYVASISYAVSPFQLSTPPTRRRPRDSLLCGFLSINCPATPGTDNGTGVDIYGLGEHSCFHSRNQAPSLQGSTIPTRIRVAWLTYPPDTGIYIEHNDFGGRAVHGPAFGPYNSSDDGNG
jgi:hypothetical protein